MTIDEKWRSASASNAHKLGSLSSEIPVLLQQTLPSALITNVTNLCKNVFISFPDSHFQTPPLCSDTAMNVGTWTFLVHFDLHHFFTLI